MELHDVQEKVRELITETDQLSRHAHAARSLRDAEVFASLRTSLQRVEREIGASTRHSGLAGELDVLYQRVRDAAARVREDQRPELGPLLASAEALHAQLRSQAPVRRERAFQWPAALRTRPVRAARAAALVASALALVLVTFYGVKGAVRALGR